MSCGLPVVHVLLATFNGERYLRAQWASLEEQEGVQIVLHVTDDGSSDGTVALLGEFAAVAGGAVREVRWVNAPPRRSATRSFFLLLTSALRSSDAQWFAYCDQDDVWLPGKLAAALASLESAGDGQAPALYGGRSITVDGEDRERGPSPLFVHPPAFRNALVQNIMGGNTMVMNRAAAWLVTQSSHHDVVWHDWLTYQVVSGAGGFVHYDPKPYLRYRQHGRNVMGSNLRWRARLARLLAMLQGEYREWNRLNVAALQERADVLTPANRSTLGAFSRAREASTPWARMRWLRRSGVFRQKRSEQLMLWLACLLRRI